MREAQSTWERARSLLPVLVSGVSLMFVASWLVPDEHWKSFVAELGVALVVVFGLGLTIDYWLKRALLEDVFKAVLGYVLPEQLRAEMEWVYGLRIVCILHIEAYSIQLIDDDYVTVRTKISRKMRNYGNREAEISPSLAIDEWFISGHPSRILDMGYSLAGERWPRPGKAFDVTRSSTATIHMSGERHKLLPGQEIEVWSEYEQVRRSSDELVTAFTIPTSSPRVTVHHSPELTVDVFFGHREQGRLHELGAGPLSCRVHCSLCSKSDSDGIRPQT